MEGSVDKKTVKSLWELWAEENNIQTDSADHFINWRDDLDNIAGLGIKQFRASISWSRYKVK